MFCNQCGAKAGGQGFCSRCGKTLPVGPGPSLRSEGALSSAPTQQPEPPVTQQVTAPAEVTREIVVPERKAEKAKPVRKDPRKRALPLAAIFVTVALTLVVSGAGLAVWRLLPDNQAASEESAQTTPSSGTYGSNPDLDSLWDSCSAGNMGACDELYLASPSGSDYETFGGTCGNRNGEPAFCETLAGGEQASEGGFGSDPLLDLLWSECEAGTYTACDDLYSESPLGSEYEEFGATCGNRGLPEGNCVIRFD